MYDYVVIGGGSGGLASARRAASYGAKVCLIERWKHHIGGTCVNLGCVPKKIMYNAAHIAELLPVAADYGFNVAQEVKIDWKYLVKKREDYIERLRGIYENNLTKDKVDLVYGTASLNDNRSVQVRGPDGLQTIQGKYILIATGGHAIVPNVPGSNLGVTSDGFFSFRDQPKHVVIVGAGYIAVELSFILAALGTKVVLLIRHDKVLRRFDPIISDTVHQQLINAGVQIVPHATVQRLEKGKVFFNDTQVDTEEVIWAIGRAPNLNGMELIEKNEQGFIKVDEYQNTNISGILALGDVCGVLELTPVAIAAGRKLSDRLFGGQADAKLDYKSVASVIFSHPPSGTVGLTEAEARVQYKDKIKVYQSKFTNMFYSMTEHKQPSAFKMIVTLPEERVVGLHLVGLGADEMLQGFAIAVRMGLTKKEFDSTVAIHPTAAEEVVTMRSFL